MLQANSLVKGLKERFPDVKPWNVELFGGSPDDNNAFFFYDGAMSVLQPLIDDGTIVVPSGQMGMDVVGTLRWLTATSPRPAWITCCRPTTPTPRCTACCRPTTASRSASSRR